MLQRNYKARLPIDYSHRYGLRSRRSVIVSNINGYEPNTTVRRMPGRLFAGFYATLYDFIANDTARSTLPHHDDDGSVVGSNNVRKAETLLTVIFRRRLFGL